MCTREYPIDIRCIMINSFAMVYPRNKKTSVEESLFVEYHEDDADPYNIKQPDWRLYAEKPYYV